MVRVARNSTPQRRSARISSLNSPQKDNASSIQLGSLTERDETPDTNQTSIDHVIGTPAAERRKAQCLEELSKISTPKTQPRVSSNLMHPATIHQSTAKAPDSGMKLGFADITTTEKPSIASLQNTPSRPRQSMARTNISPGFQFKFAHQSNMSQESQELMDSIKDEAAVIKAQMRAEKEEQAKVAAVERKLAQPKPRIGRFSEVHLGQFKKMDSIANHPSAFRAAPSFARPTEQSLKRSSSKADLEERPQTAGKSPGRRVPPPVTGRPTSTSPFKSIRSPPKIELETKRARKNGDIDITTSRPSSTHKVPLFLSPTKASTARIDDSSTPVKPSAIPRSNSVKSVKSVSHTTVFTYPSINSRMPQTGSAKPLPALPQQAATSPHRFTFGETAAKPVQSPTKPESEKKSRLPTLAGLRSILRSPRKASNQDASPVRDSAVEGSPKRVDFTPSVKSRYAVKLAATSPSPAKVDRKIEADKFEPAMSYDPAMFYNHYQNQENDWEDAEDSVAYPELSAAPVDKTFTQYAKAHSRRESKEFKSIFTDLHPIKREPHTGLTAANTTVNRTNPITHAAHMSRSPVKPKSPTIRHVRDSEPVMPFEDSITTIPHGLPGKKRRVESVIADDKFGADEDAKENRRLSHHVTLPGSWTDSIVEQDESDERAGKRVKVHEGEKQNSPVKKSAARELAAKTAKDRKKGRQSTVGGPLSLSRLNALAQPKNRV